MFSQIGRSTTRQDVILASDRASPHPPKKTICCHIGELNQVVLNIVVNAAHAIGDVVRGTEDKGRIRVRTSRDGGEVVDKHHGRIAFETEVKKGTTFTIHLPIDGAHSASSDAA